MTVLPVNECKWMFKEGDVAVLSTPRPGSFRSKRNNFSVVDEGDEPEITGRVAGTVRRFMPIDTRDPPGAILHFYVGDSYDSNRLSLLYSALDYFTSNGIVSIYYLCCVVPMY